MDSGPFVFEQTNLNCLYHQEKSVVKLSQMKNLQTTFSLQCGWYNHRMSFATLDLLRDDSSKIWASQGKSKSKRYLEFFMRLFSHLLRHFYVFQRNLCNWRHYQKSIFSVVHQKDLRRCFQETNFWNFVF